MDTGGCGRAWGGIAYTNFEFALFVSKAGHWKAECLLQKYGDVRTKSPARPLGQRVHGTTNTSVRLGLQQILPQRHRRILEKCRIAGKARSLMFSLANTLDPHRHVAETRRG